VHNIHQPSTCLEFWSSVFLGETRGLTLFEDINPWVGSAKEHRPKMFVYRRFGGLPTEFKESKRVN
jgi:hypothetical protein